MRRLLAVGLVTFAAAGCDGSGVGEVVFELTTPNTDDGAIQFVITAKGPEELVSVTAACTACQVFTESMGPTEIRGVVLGDVRAGPVLRVTVTDRKAAAAYAARVLAVSDRDYALRFFSGYSLTPRS